MGHCYGIISEVDEAKGYYRVQLDDLDIVTDWLPRSLPNTLDNQDEAHFDVNEHVVLLMDENFEHGIIIGAINDDTSPPPAGANKDIRRTTFKDGSFIQFDRSTGAYEINVKGDANITAEGNVNVMADGDINAAAGGDIIATADGNIEYTGTIIKLNGDGNNGIVKAAVVKTKLNALEIDDNKLRAAVAAMAAAATSAPTTPITNALLYAFFSAVTFPIVALTPTVEAELRNDTVKH